MAPRESLRRRALVGVRKAVHRAGFDVVREPFKHRFVYALDRYGIDTVLDIGANSGQFGQALRRAGYRGSVLSVEPLGEPYAALERAAADDPTWRTERAAVSDELGTITMNVSHNSVSSSVLPMLERSVQAAPGTRYVATEEVAAVTVDDLVERHGLDPARTLLKVDVQGYERAVLDGAGKSLPDFAAVRAELTLVPLYEGQALMPDMIAHLALHGFELWDVEPGFTEPDTRRLLQLDGVFLRATTKEAGRGR